MQQFIHLHQILLNILVHLLRGIITGAVPILGVWTFCLGASINVRATATVVRKAGAVIGAKLFIAWMLALVLGSLMQPDEMLNTPLFAGFLF